MIDKKWGYVDKSGEVIIEPQFTFTRSFSEGLAAVQIGEKWGYIDSSGRLVIPAQFEAAGSFSEGLARVALGGLYGYINKNGIMVIAPQFPVAIAPDAPQDSFEGAFRQGLASISRDAGEAYIDTTGKFMWRSKP